MPEETEQLVSQTEESQTQQTDDSQQQAESVQLTNFIGENGELKEGWKDVLVPEELRSNKFYDMFSDVQGVMKAAGHQSVTLGKYGTTKGILPVNEKSSSYEIEAFREALGVPKDETGYEYTPPEDISTVDMSPEYLQPALAEFNKSHYTQPQVDVAMNVFANYIRSVEKAVDEELAKRVSDAQNRLETEYGDRLESRTNLARAFITKMTSGWNPEKYNELFGEEVIVENEDGTQEKTREGGINDAEFASLRPLLLDLFATIEEKYGTEDSALMSEVTGTPVKSIQRQIEELEATDGFMDGKLRSSLDTRDREKYEELIKQRDILYKKLYPG